MVKKQRIVTEFRRREILDAARRVFARHGFTRGVVDAIAKEAGLAKGTIYLYFGSKKEIYKADLQSDMEALKKRNLERIDAAASLKEKLRAFIVSRLENAEEKREFFRIMDSEPESMSYTRSQYREWLREPVLRLAAALAEASSRGEIRPFPPEKTAWAVADMTRGSIQRRLLGQGEPTPRQEADFLLAFVWAALEPDAAPSQKHGA